MYTRQPSAYNGTGYGDPSDVIKHEEAHPGRRENMVIWGVACAAFTVFIFFVATCQYFRKRAASPKAKKLRKMKSEEKNRAEEEKKIMGINKQQPVHVNDFLEALRKKKKKRMLDIEFKALQRFQTEHTSEVAHLPENLAKNYSTVCLPFDYNRVVLPQVKGDKYSDYINASYIDTFEREKAYIAAQGPSRQAVMSFWRMVWEENVHCIVMATNVFEHARQQCEKYWHNQHGRYGAIDVWLEECDNLSEFSIRTFRIHKSGTEGHRVVKHFQFASWSDHECPNPSSVLEYRRRIRSWYNHVEGPLLVHCGAGGGRAGTFIAIDALIDQLEHVDTLDVFSFVLQLRNSRPNMVSHLSLYEFLYEVLAMHIRCGTTVIPAQEVQTAVHKLAMKDPHSKMTGFEKEFKTLDQVVPKLTVGECAGGHRSENRRKSRDIMLQPPERARPYLITHDSNDSTDYINACYVDGYRHPNTYIVTQWPLTSTINDIWRMVYDYNVKTLILLNDVHFSKNPVVRYFQSYPRFWPAAIGRPTSYGPLSVELLSEKEEQFVTMRTFKVRKAYALQDLRDYIGQWYFVDSGPETLVSLQNLGSQMEDSVKIVRLFQLHSWPSSHKVPTSATSIIELVSKVEDWTQETGVRAPICVISKDGASRCGFYCAVSMAWEKLRAEGEVDIFRVCKIVKANRPQLVNSLYEYMLVYGVLCLMVDAIRISNRS